MINKAELKAHILDLRKRYRYETDPAERSRLTATHARLMVAYRQMTGHTLDLSLIHI